MNPLRRLTARVEPGPDPWAVGQGLTVRRVGWGTYVYTGLPTCAAGRSRRQPDPNDPLDRLWAPPTATTPERVPVASASR